MRHARGIKVYTSASATVIIAQNEQTGAWQVHVAVDPQSPNIAIRKGGVSPINIEYITVDTPENVTCALEIPELEVNTVGNISGGSVAPGFGEGALDIRMDIIGNLGDPEAEFGAIQAASVSAGGWPG